MGDNGCQFILGVHFMISQRKIAIVGAGLVGGSDRPLATWTILAIIGYLSTGSTELPSADEFEIIAAG